MLAKREKNGDIGESRTYAILADHFWILRRSVDVEGADFLVQLQAESLSELVERQSKIQVFGIVQAKFFEGNNQVRINKDYVINGDTPRKEFFAFLHTNDQDGKWHHYLFSSNDIIDVFYESSCGKYYCFSLTEERGYLKYKDVSNKEIEVRIRNAIVDAELDKNAEFIEQLYNVYKMPTQHYELNPDFEYKLTFVDGHPVVLCSNLNNGARSLLEYRRDLYNNLGNFTWGYRGTGSYFLATCLLSHHFNGQAPSQYHIELLLLNLIEILDRDKEHVITSGQIQKAILDKKDCAI